MNSALVLGLIPKYWEPLLDLRVRKNQPPTENRLQCIEWYGWTLLDCVVAAPSGVVNLLSCGFCDNPAPALAFVALGWTHSVGHFCFGLFLFPRENKELLFRQHFFPRQPIWIVWHPNPHRVSCHPVCHSVTLLLEKVPPRRSIGLSVLPESCIPSYLHTPSLASRQGSVQAWGQRGGVGWWNAGHVSSTRQKENVLTWDRGSCFDFAIVNQEWCFGSSLWSFGMSLLLFQR